jgi:hypothetical protein
MHKVEKQTPIIEETELDTEMLEMRLPIGSATGFD